MAWQNQKWRLARQRYRSAYSIERDSSQRRVCDQSDYRKEVSIINENMDWAMSSVDPNFETQRERI
jgi:hypothetical protein